MMNKEGPPDASGLDVERVRGFISECARLHGKRHIRFLMARGWQEADAKDIVQQAFTTMMKPDVNDYAVGFEATAVETDYNPDHYRCRSYVGGAVRYTEKTAYRKNGALRYSGSDSDAALESPPSPTTSEKEGAEKLQSETEKRFLRRHAHYWIDSFFRQRDRDDVLIHLKQRSEINLLREIDFWFKNYCQRCDYRRHLEVYRLLIVEEAERESIASELGITEDRVSSIGSECRLLCGVAGRLIVRLESTSKARTLNGAQKLQVMRQSIDTLLTDEDELITDGMKKFFERFLAGEIIAKLGKNNRLSFDDLDQLASRDMLSFAAKTLGLVLHITNRYTGASAHGDQ